MSPLFPQGSARSRQTDVMGDASQTEPGGQLPASATQAGLQLPPEQVDPVGQKAPHRRRRSRDAVLRNAATPAADSLLSSPDCTDGSRLESQATRRVALLSGASAIGRAGCGGAGRWREHRSAIDVIEADRIGAVVKAAVRPARAPCPASATVVIAGRGVDVAIADAVALATGALPGSPRAAGIRGTGAGHDPGAIERLGAGVVHADLGRLAGDPAPAAVLGVGNGIGAGAVAARSIAQRARNDAVVTVAAGSAGLGPAGVAGRTDHASRASGVLAIGQRRTRASVDSADTGRAEAPGRAGLAAIAAVLRIAIGVRAGSVAAGARAAVRKTARPKVVAGSAGIDGLTASSGTHIAARTDDAAPAMLPGVAVRTRRRRYSSGPTVQVPRRGPTSKAHRRCRPCS